MTVRELIEKLQAMPQDVVVVVDGYEGGVEEPTQVRAAFITRNANEPEDWFFGHHEVAEAGEPVVYIERR